MKDTAMTDEVDDLKHYENLFTAMDQLDAERYEERHKAETIGDLMDRVEEKNKKLFSSLKVQNSQDFFKHRPPPISWLVEGIMEEHNLVMLAGAPKTAKSWVAIELGLSVATGAEMFGDPMLTGNGKEGTVLFFFLEDGAHNIHARVTSLAKQKGVKDPRNLSLFFRFGGGIDIGNRADVTQLAAAIKGGIPDLDLIVFDPFRNMHYGDENDSATIIQVMENLRHIRDVTGAAILVTHHTRKPSASDRNNPGFAIRGSGAIFGSVDGLIAMSSIEDIDKEDNTITNNVFVRVKAGKEAHPFSISLRIKDGYDGRAESARWSVGAKI